VRRVIVASVALVVALLAQLTIVNGLPLPGGGTPDLVLLCVVAIGMTSGPRAGLIAGFAAGLALDLAPPASQLVGQYALVFCLAGYFSGKMRFVLRHSAFLSIAVAAVIAVATEAVAAGLSLVLDSPGVPLSTAAHVLAASMLYDLALTPIVLLVAVRIAMALGASYDVLGDSPALETGGSAARTARAGLATVTIGRRRRAAWGGLGMSQAASGRWLAGDSAGEVPAVGAIGWLDGPARSRRARRKHATITAMATGASQRAGASWVGRRPPGLVPAQPAYRASTASGLVRLRVATGVAGSASSHARPVPGVPRQRGLARIAFAPAGHAPGLAGIDRAGVSGRPTAPRIAFGTGGVPGAGRAAGRGTPRIAFGHEGHASPGPAGGRGTPRIPFGHDGQAAGPSVAGTDGAGLASRHGTPRIAFGTGGLAGSGRAAGRGAPHIAFGTGGLASAARTSKGRPAVPRFRSAAARSATSPWLARSALAARGVPFASGPALPGSVHGLPGGIGYGGRRPRQPRLARGMTAHQPRRTRQPKMARLATGNRSPHWLPHLRRAGDRSTVWRIGGTRAGSYR
jgi:rod shape-determining protein MreD